MQSMEGNKKVRKRDKKCHEKDMVGKMEADGDSEKEVEVGTEQTSADIQK